MPNHPARSDAVLPPASARRVSLDDLLRVLWDAARGPGSAYEGTAWADLDEETRVWYALRAVPLLNVTRCGCRFCRKGTLLRGSLSVSKGLLAEIDARSQADGSAVK